MYTASKSTTKNFIAQSAVSDLRKAMQKSHGKLPSEDLAKSLFENSLNNKQLLNRFGILCSQLISERKRKTKEIYFNTLGYCYIISVKSKGDEMHDIRKSEQMKDVYKKLYSVKRNGERDMAYWRTACFDDICENKMVGKDCKNIENDAVDNLFNNGAAVLALEQFRKFEMKETDDASLMTLVRLDTVMTSFIALDET